MVFFFFEKVVHVFYLHFSTKKTSLGTKLEKFGSKVLWTKKWKSKTSSLKTNFGWKEVAKHQQEKGFGDPNFAGSEVQFFQRKMT